VGPQVLRRADVEALMRLEPAGSSLAQRKELVALLTVDDAQLRAFAHRPLDCIDIMRFVTFSTGQASSASTPAPAVSMPFDVSQHPDAAFLISRKMIARLEEDLGNHQKQVHLQTRCKVLNDDIRGRGSNYREECH
jgi:hypothetical protein